MDTDRWLWVLCLMGMIKLNPSRLGENLLLTHGRAVSCYRKHFQDEQRGVIGITLVCRTAFHIGSPSVDVLAEHRVGGADRWIPRGEEGSPTELRYHGWLCGYRSTRRHADLASLRTPYVSCRPDSHWFLSDPGPDLGRHNKAAVDVSKGRIRDFTPEEWSEIAHSSDL